MRFAILIVCALLSPFGAQAAMPTIAKCTVQHDGRLHAIHLKLDRAGKIVRWDRSRWAKVSRDSVFAAFAEDVDEYGFEWEKSFMARNGYSILELGTTADSFTVGVNLAVGKGFFRYKDLGSGAGDSSLVLICTPSIR
jgi:hypothetical protein